MHWRGVNTATDHKNMWGWILQPVGVLLVGILGGGSSAAASRWLWEHGQGEAAVGAGHRRKPCLYHPSSSSLLSLRMDWESDVWSYFCTSFGWFWSWSEVAGTCCETRHFHFSAAPRLEANFSPTGTKTSVCSNITITPVLPISPSAFKIHSFVV